MVRGSSPSILKSCLLGGLVFLFFLAFLRCYFRTQATLTGYKLGELKGREAELLEERSRLKVRLATLTTKESLQQRSILRSKAR